MASPSEIWRRRFHVDIKPGDLTARDDVVLVAGNPNRDEILNTKSFEYVPTFGAVLMLCNIDCCERHNLANLAICTIIELILTLNMRTMLADVDRIFIGLIFRLGWLFVSPIIYLELKWLENLYILTLSQLNSGEGLEPYLTSMLDRTKEYCKLVLVDGISVADVANKYSLRNGL